MIKIYNKRRLPLTGNSEEWFCLRCGYKMIRPLVKRSNYMKCPKCGYLMKKLPKMKKPPRYIS